MSENTPYLDEHQAPDKSPNPTPGNSPEDEKIIKMVYKLFEKSKRKKSQYDHKWLSYYKMFRGVQWQEARPSYRHSEVINMIFPAIQGQVSTMMSVRPKVEYLPQEPSDRDFSDIMNQLFQADWEANAWLEKTTEVVYDGHFYGTGISNMEWDPDEGYGDGKIIYKSYDPFYFFPDDNAEDINGCDSEWLITAEPKETKRMKRKYPKKSHLIKPDMQDLAASGDRTDLGEIRFRSPVNSKIEMDQSNPEEYKHDDKSLVLTCYLKRKDLKEEEFQDEDGKKKYRQMLKEPRGRKIVIAGGALCEDIKELPYDDLKFPFSKYNNYILPREFWGVSEIEPLESPQKTFNKLVSFALDVLTITGNPVWIIDTSSGVDAESIFNRPGLIIEKEAGSEVRREAGVQLQPFVMQLIDRMESWFNNVAQNAEVTRGMAPGGVTANAAIENLMDAAKTTIKQKMRNIDRYLVDIGQQYKSRVLQFYTQKRVFRLTNKDGSFKYFRFGIEDSEDGGKMGVVSDFETNELGDLSEGEPRSFQIRGDLDVRATTGTGLPFAEAERDQRLFQLFDRQIIDAEEVLRGIDYPNADKVLQRVRDQQAAMAQAEAQQV